VYGVVLDSDRQVAGEATRARRLMMRGERIGGTVEESSLERADVPDSGMPINAYLQACVDGVQCTWCGHLLCEREQAWKDVAACRELPPPAGGMFRNSLENVVLRQFACIRCGTLLETEVACIGDALVHDEVNNWPDSSARGSGDQPSHLQESPAS
jgi:hypothetical protein